MPDAVTFRVSTYYKLAPGESGFTQKDSHRLSASQALDWVLAELGEDAWSLEHGQDKVTITIDWSQVPGEVRDPKIPARRR